MSDLNPAPMLDTASPEPQAPLPDAQPDPAPPMPAAAALAAAFVEADALARRAAELGGEVALAEKEAAGLREAADAATVAHARGRMSGPELDAARQAANEAAYRAADLEQERCVLAAALPQARQDAFALAPAARAELGRIAGDKLAMLDARARPLLSEVGQIVGEALAIATAADQPDLTLRRLAGTLPGGLAYDAGRANIPKPPAGPLTDALRASLGLVERAERDRRQAESATHHERLTAEGRRRMARV